MKVYNLVFLFLCFIFVNISIYGDFSKLYTVGNGQQYKLTAQSNDNLNVMIYIAGVKKESVNIEFYIETDGGFVKTGIWQQFELEKNGPKLKMEKGYIKTKEMKTPEILPSSNLAGNQNLKMSQFLISNEEDLQKYFIRNETVSVPAGNVEAKVYKVDGEGQTIHFWVAKDSKPLTFVKITSQGAKKDQNYALELLTLVQGVGASIKPKDAIPLSDKMKKILGTSN